LTAVKESTNTGPGQSKKIVLITSGLPALNPRLVKEADALADAGYGVTVIYTYWSDWGAALNDQLLAGKKWEAIQAGGDPVKKPLVYFVSRLIHKTSRFIVQKTGQHRYISELAIARSAYFLTKETKKHPADLYIAHNLGALPTAVKTAALYKKLCGFDAEDFHRQEADDDAHSYRHKVISFIEDKYLPLVNYLTASSPLIAEKYASLYKRTVPCILNVFPKTNIPPAAPNENKPLKLFWFSQNLGPKRGLEIIVEAMGLTRAPVELHLLGNCADGYKQHLLQLAQNFKADVNALFFYLPIKADEIFNLASGFDIGLASETGFSLNNNIALSNKLFTYIQSGLAVAASNTSAQSRLIRQYPQVGKVYNDAAELAEILNTYSTDRQLLTKTKNDAFKIGQAELNWENESHKFLNIINDLLAS